MKPGGVRARTEVGAEDLGWWDAGTRELVAIGQPQVEMRLSPRRPLEPVFQIVFRVSRRSKRLDDFFTHLAAATAERRSHGGNDIGRIRSELGPHRVDRRGGDPLHRAAPPRVHRRDGAGPLVAEEDGRAIGNADDERGRRISADDRIRFWRLPTSQPVFARDDDGVAVHLLQRQQAIPFDTRECRNAPPFVLALAQFEGTVGKEVWRHRREGRTS